MINIEIIHYSVPPESSHFDRVSDYRHAQTYILPGITLASGCVIAYAILAYIAYLHRKMDSPSEVDGSGRRPCKRRLFEGSESWIIIVVFAIASILIFIGWYFYYTGHIGSFSSDTLGTMTQTAIIGEWFKQLLCCQIGCATFFISLALIMVRLSTSVYSIRAFKSAFNPLDTDKASYWVVWIYASRHLCAWFSQRRYRSRCSDYLI